MRRRQRPTLHTIPMSHYGERARWALDRAGIDYDEVHHLQVFSWIPAYRYGHGPTLPVLVLPDRVLADSRDIVRWADPQGPAPLLGTPSDAAAEDLERRLVGDFGVATRLEVYDWFLPRYHDYARYNAGHASPIAVTAHRLLAPVLRPLGRARLGVNDDAVCRARALVDRTFDEIAVLLRDGRRYLFGDRFGVADLAWATMSAPVLAPERYGLPLPPLSALPADFATRVRQRRDHPAGRFALALYEERPPRRWPSAETQHRQQATV